MAGILIIEQSSTLSNLLIRALHAGGHATTTVINQFDQALTLLKENVATEEPYSAIVLGIPEPFANPIKPILGFLRNNDQAAQIPVVVLQHSPIHSLEVWMEQRGRCTTVPWKQFATLHQHVPKPVDQGNLAIIPNRTPSFRDVKVLFVDDSQSARYVYSRLLQSMGFPVTLASDLEEARDKALSTSFDLVIVDYYLPDGTGDQLCVTLSEQTQPVPKMAIITGTYKEEIIKNCLDAGASDCIFKNEAKELFITRVSSLARTIQTQQSIEAERSRLEGILGSVGDGVYGVDEQGRISFINPVATDILGYDNTRELIGKPARSILHGNLDDSDPTIAALLRSYRTGDTLNAHETVFQTRDQVTLPIECTVFPLSIETSREGSVVVFRDISERKTVEQLQWELSHDSLTGLLNKRQFLTHLEEAVASSQDSDTHHALLWIDLDRFEEVVDSTSHAEADRIIADVAKKLSLGLRDRDLLARFEGDTFILLLSGIQLANLFTVAENYRTSVSEVSYQENGDSRQIAASVGVVIIAASTTSAEYAMRQASEACETAKKRGRDQTYLYLPDEDTQMARKIEDGWSDRFRNALRNNQFTMLIQPIVPVRDIPVDWKRDNPSQLQIPVIQGDNHRQQRIELLFEALIRMQGGDKEWISPTVFVPLAERVQMIQEIDLWVVRHALQFLDQRNDARYLIHLTLNLSNLTLQDPASLESIGEAIAEKPELASRLIFEITETAEIESLHNARRFINEIKKLGCRFALDDFGTGFSSFSHLKHLAVDFIKIDGMFVQSMVHNEVDRTMVNSITNMAHSLGLKTIGEHIDSSMILEAARDSQIDYVQGNYFGQPIRMDQLNLDAVISRSINDSGAA